MPRNAPQPAQAEKKAEAKTSKVEEYAQYEEADKADESGSEEEPAEKPRQKIVQVDQMQVGFTSRIHSGHLQVTAGTKELENSVT